MNYLEMIKRQRQSNTAVICDGRAYSYGKLSELAAACSRDTDIFPERDGLEKKQLHMIKKEKIMEQLIEFLACYERNLVPLIVSMDAKTVPEKIKVPEEACMAVMTSGTSGEAKVLFRTYESWADFFPVQNEIFGVGENSRLFAQGSLSFTGNLNLYMAQFSAGAAVIAEDRFSPRKWAELIQQEQADKIYLIPSKLMCLPRILKEKNTRVKTILSGSQSLGKEDTEKLKQYFPEADIILYYGASEVSYITYVMDKHMTGEKNLVGKPFPGIDLFIREEEIFVNTPYHIIGIDCPYTLKDKGYLDEEGNLYFNGRSDDIIGIHGRKISLHRIENELNRLAQVKEAAVIAGKENGRDVILAFVCLEENAGITVEKNIRKDIIPQLKQRLSDYELPDRIMAVKEFPKNESGKIQKTKLEREYLI
jgi:long-chain acyl-CoA synthetase